MLGKSLSEYINFQKVFLILVLIVGLGRLALSLAGVPNSIGKWLSITVVLLLGLIYYAIRVHTSGFGSYKQLLPLLFIQNALGQLIVIAGIVLAIVTQKDNIFSAPEFSGGGDGKTFVHITGHLIAIIVIPLIGWAIASLIMFVTKRIAPHPKPVGSMQ
jgi:hypothetical protein